jgi:hypothetical protein
MAIINNQILGPIKQESKVKKLHPIYLILGNIFGFPPFILSIFLRGVCIHFVWNTFMVGLPIPHLELSEATAIAAILLLSTMKYPGFDFFDSFIDLTVKTILIGLSCLAFNYYF